MQRARRIFENDFGIRCAIDDAFISQTPKDLLRKPVIEKTRDVRRFGRFKVAAIEIDIERIQRDALAVQCESFDLRSVRQRLWAAPRPIAQYLLGDDGPRNFHGRRRAALLVLVPRRTQSAAVKIIGVRLMVGLLGAGDKRLAPAGGFLEAVEGERHVGADVFQQAVANDPHTQMAQARRGGRAEAGIAQMPDVQGLIQCRVEKADHDRRRRRRQL